MIHNTINDKVYIGQSINILKRWADHRYALNGGYHANIHLQRSWDKYGENAFEFRILHECMQCELDEKEIEYIALYHSHSPSFGYNQTSGGEGSPNRSEESNNRFRQSFYKYITNHPDYIESKRAKTLEQFKDPEFYSRYLQLRQSAAFREKQRLSHLGKHQTEESKRKISQTLGKPVICVETGIIYQSAREAERSLPGNVNIKAVLNHQRKTAGGYHWKRIDDMDDFAQTA